MHRAARLRRIVPGRGRGGIPAASDRWRDGSTRNENRRSPRAPRGRLARRRARPRGRGRFRGDLHRPPARARSASPRDGRTAPRVESTNRTSGRAHAHGADRLRARGRARAVRVAARGDRGDRGSPERRVLRPVEPPRRSDPPARGRDVDRHAVHARGRGSCDGASERAPRRASRGDGRRRACTRRVELAPAETAARVRGGCRQSAPQRDDRVDRRRGRSRHHFDPGELAEPEAAGCGCSQRRPSDGGPARHGSRSRTEHRASAARESLRRFCVVRIESRYAAGCAPIPTIHTGPEETAMLRLQTDVKGEGAPLVLVGGGLTGWLSWVPHQERLASTRQVVRVQPLSVQYGLEDRPLPPNYGLEMESDALAASIDGLGLRGRVDLVAWSYGAAITLDYALDHPDRVRTLALVEPPAFWVLEATGRLDVESKRQRDEMLALYAGMTVDVTEDQLATFVRQAGLCPPGQSPPELPAWPSWVEHRRSLRVGVAPWHHGDTAARLRAFHRPVLLVKGTGSSHFLHQIIAGLASALPDSEMVEFPGGHAPQIVAMDAFLAKLATFEAAGE